MPNVLICQNAFASLVWAAELPGAPQAGEGVELEEGAREGLAARGQHGKQGKVSAPELRVLLQRHGASLSSIHLGSVSEPAES